MISAARIRTIASWLPTLDETRLREVEDFVLAKAIEQQDSAPADTVVPHDGERTHGGNFAESATGTAPEYPAVATAPRPAVDTDTRSGFDTLSPLVSAAGRHGAQRDAVTPLDPGHETPTGGDSSDCECSDEPWLRHRADDRAESHMPWCPARINATPEVPDLNSAEMWRAEVDGKFDDGGES